MKEHLKKSLETPESGEIGRRANPSAYLDQRSATILVVIKLAEALTMLCLTILAAFVLRSAVSALNRIFQEGTTVADGKAMVAQFLKTLRVPMESIKQIVDAFPTDISFSSKPAVVVFVICLPFVVIAVLEAIAAIRLRLGKGGTRVIGILQMLYYILGGIRLLVFALTAIVLSIITIFRLGGAPSLMLSTGYVSLAVFFILIGLPTLLYHRNLARIMDDIRYEMETGRQAVRKHNHFKKVLTTLIVLTVIGAAATIAAYWRPQQGGLAVGLLLATMAGPVVKLIKYICMMYCNRNFMQADSTEESEGDISHVPQIILIVLVILLFAIPTAFLCTQSSVFSTALVEKVEEFTSNARQTVDELSAVAEKQIETVQTVMDQAGLGEVADALQNGTKEESVGTTVSPQDVVKEEAAGTTVSSQNVMKEEAAEAAAASKAVTPEEDVVKQNGNTADQS